MGVDEPEVVELCGRCARELRDRDRIELCIWCEGPLCEDCWEVPGHCGHPEWALLLEEFTDPLTTRERKAEIMASPGRIRAVKARRFH